MRAKLKKSQPRANEMEMDDAATEDSAASEDAEAEEEVEEEEESEEEPAPPQPEPVRRSRRLQHQAPAAEQVAQTPVKQAEKAPRAPQLSRLSKPRLSDLLRRPQWQSKRLSLPRTAFLSLQPARRRPAQSRRTTSPSSPAQILLRLEKGAHFVKVLQRHLVLTRALASSALGTRTKRKRTCQMQVSLPRSSFLPTCSLPDSRSVAELLLHLLPNLPLPLLRRTRQRPR